MPDFSLRADLAQFPEWMDGPCRYEDLRACLHDIAQANRLTRAYRPTLEWLQQVARSAYSSRPLRIVDVGCGYGDMLRQIDRWATLRNIAVELIGIDLNADAVRAAREATPAGSQIQWVASDVYSCAAARTADIVISSLLTHHMPEPAIVKFLAWMEQTAQVGWFVNDLHRQPVPFYAFRAIAAVAGWHRFVKHDGPVSVLRSFVPADWRRICAAAGVDGRVAITGHRPARLCVSRIK